MPWGGPPVLRIVWPVPVRRPTWRQLGAQEKQPADEPRREPDFDQPHGETSSPPGQVRLPSREETDRMNKLVVRAFLQLAGHGHRAGDRDPAPGVPGRPWSSFTERTPGRICASGCASSRRSWWRGRICGGHAPEPSPPLEPREERPGARQPVGQEEGGGDLPLRGSHVRLPPASMGVAVRSDRAWRLESYHNR